MSHNKTILIGPTGFLGPAFLEACPSMVGVGRSPLPPHISNDWFRISSDTDFSELDELDFEKVIFLIGSSDHHILNNSPTLAVEKNVIPLQRFLYWAQHNNRKLKKIVTFTTMLQYDSKKMVLPCPECAPKLPEINNYVLSKYFAEKVTQSYRKTLDIIDIRLSNVYGPTRLRRPDLVPSLVWSLLEDESVSVATKKPIRDFVFVADVIDAVLRLMESDFSGPINVGSGIGASVEEVCDILEGVSGRKIGDRGLSGTGHAEYRHDLSLLESIIGQYDPVRISEGLAATYLQMKEFHEQAD